MRRQGKLTALAWVLSVFLVGASYYFQHEMKMEPCTLCLLQRFLMIGVAVLLSLMLLIRSPQILGRLFSLLTAVVAGAGAYVSYRHIMLQNMPEGDIPASCSADLQTMLEHLPIKKVLQELLSSSADCAKISWEFFGYSMPHWTLVAFGLFALIGFVLIFTRR